MEGAGLYKRMTSTLPPGDTTVLVAPDSFKGSLSAREAAEAMEEGIHDAFPGMQAVLHPLSDGGEGLLAVLVPSLRGVILHNVVAGPLPGRRVTARWGYVEESRVAVIEMAEAAGLTLVPEGERDPCVTTTAGVGELMLLALDRGARTLLIGIGGSATNDGGAGMAETLGVRFLDAGRRSLPPGGAALQNLDAIDLRGLDQRIRGVRVVVACDVRNPLTGPEGASAVFGPQKGASSSDIALLDAALMRYRDVIRKELGTDVQLFPGSGAAGGLGAGLLAFCRAQLLPGIDLVFEHTGFDAALRRSAAVITGEGRIDRQTRFGKVLAGVLARARRSGIPAAAVVGDVQGPREEFVGADGFADLETLVNAETALEEAITHAHHLVRHRTAGLIRRIVPLITKQKRDFHAPQ